MIQKVCPIQTYTQKGLLLPVFALQLFQTKELSPKSFNTIPSASPKLLIFSQGNPLKKIGFSGHDNFSRVMTTSLIEMLELPNFAI